MGVPAEKRRSTIDQYLKLEAQAVDRHEFHDGEILAMSGGTYRHSLINTNLLAALHSLLRGSPCRPLDSNMRVRISGKPTYVYPDISVVCGGPIFDVDDPNETTITNPRMVCEILSDSTESYDRGEKFNLYGAVESLDEYVLVSQRHVMIETFLRQSDGTWLSTAWQGIESSLLLRSLHIAIPMADIYEGIEFDAPPSTKMNN